MQVKPADGGGGQVRSRGEDTEVINSTFGDLKTAQFNQSLGSGQRITLKTFIQKNTVRTFLEGSGEQLDDFSGAVLSLNCCDSSWWQKDHSVEN